MPLFLDTTGRSSLAIGICGRCSVKMPIGDLYDDPNYPGLKVCLQDRDVLDPWRLAPRAVERISLEFARPDIPLAAQGAIPVYANQVFGISETQPTVPWAARAPYVLGASVTPVNVNALQTTQLPQYQFIAIEAGNSGAQAPVWPAAAGVEVQDGTVRWICVGLYLI